MNESHRDPQFDRHAAVTRSLLGWGVLVGPLYLTAGLVLAVTRDGFRLAEHPLSVLMLGEHGWAQSANLILSGVLAGVAAYGFGRATAATSAGRWTALLLGVFAAGLIGSGVFPPDPVADFPPGSEGGEATVSGLLHLTLGAVQFIALAAAAFVAAVWMRARGDTAWVGYSRTSGVTVLVGFAGGAAMSTLTLGVVLLWVAVVAAFAWLAAASVYLWRTVPHPDAHRRTAAGADA